MAGTLTGTKLVINDANGKPFVEIDPVKGGVIIHKGFLYLVDSKDKRRITLEHGDTGTHDTHVVVHDDTAFPRIELMTHGTAYLAIPLKEDGRRVELMDAIFGVQRDVDRLDRDIQQIHKTLDYHKEQINELFGKVNKK
jgi:hypothetical protein